jgi:hypothetical protein
MFYSTICSPRCLAQKWAAEQAISSRTLIHYLIVEIAILILSVIGAWHLLFGR